MTYLNFFVRKFYSQNYKKIKNNIILNIERLIMTYYGKSLIILCNKEYNAG